MNSKVVLSVLLACGLSVSAGAAEEPGNKALLKQCESAKGEVKEECRDVAKEMIRKENQPPQERDDKTSQDVTHSSPVMTSPQEAKREAGAKQHKPAQNKDAAAPKPAQPDPAK